MAINNHFIFDPAIAYSAHCISIQWEIELSFFIVELNSSSRVNANERWTCSWHEAANFVRMMFRITAVFSAKPLIQTNQFIKCHNIGFDVIHFCPPYQWSRLCSHRLLPFHFFNMDITRIM